MVHEVKKMSQSYQPFPLEKWVVNFYYRLGITNPQDIKESSIARNLRIFLNYTERRSFSAENGRFRMINIDSRLPGAMQREHFFHELCHLLRHCGHQLAMPISFRELQEWDAAHFTRYAAIPFHMLKMIDLKSHTVVTDMAQIFKVSEDLCQSRIEHIYRNSKPKTAIYLS